MSWPLLRMTSGATYSGVPQNVQVFLPTWNKEHCKHVTRARTENEVVRSRKCFLQESHDLQTGHDSLILLPTISQWMTFLFSQFNRRTIYGTERKYFSNNHLKGEKKKLKHFAIHKSKMGGNSLAAFWRNRNRPTWRSRICLAGGSLALDHDRWCRGCGGSRRPPPHSWCRTWSSNRRSFRGLWGWSRVPLQGKIPSACRDTFCLWRFWTIWR